MMVFDIGYCLCTDCNHSYKDDPWCAKCNAERFRRDFPNWTSGNKFIDEFIQKSQLSAESKSTVLEWIPYNRFDNIKLLEKRTNSATWADGRIIRWSYSNKEWYRYNFLNVALKIID